MNVFVKNCACLLTLTLLITGCSDQTKPTPKDTEMKNPTRPVGIDFDPNNPYYNPNGGGDGEIYTEGDGDLVERGGDWGLPGSGNEEVMDVIYFGYDEYSIRPSERVKLEQVAEFLRGNPAAKIVAEGNTDWYGTTEYNLGLGDRRANAVKTYLVQLGIPADRVEILSVGELEADQDLPKDSPLVIDDRRVDLIVVRG